MGKWEMEVNPKRHGEEASGEEDGVLDGVEACAREGCRVVALVVQLVDVLVQEPALHLEMLFNLENIKDMSSNRIWSRKPVEPPGMKKAVANVIVGLSQVGHEQDPHLVKTSSSHQPLRGSHTR